MIRELFFFGKGVLLPVSEKHSPEFHLKRNGVQEYKNMLLYNIWYN